MNIGKTLAMQKQGGGLRPTLHRVVNAQEGEGQISRYAMVFFFVPNPLRMLTVYDGSDKPTRTVRAGDVSIERLQAIGTRTAQVY